MTEQPEKEHKVGSVGPEKKRVEVVFDSDDLTLDEMMGIQEGNLRILRTALGRRVKAPGGGFLPAEEGSALLGQLTLTQLTKLAKDFAAQAELPKEKEQP